MCVRAELLYMPNPKASTRDSRNPRYWLDSHGGPGGRAAAEIGDRAGGRYRLHVYGLICIKQPIPLYGDCQPAPDNGTMLTKMQGEIFTYMIRILTQKKLEVSR